MPFGRLTLVVLAVTFSGALVGGGAGALVGAAVESRSLTLAGGALGGGIGAAGGALLGLLLGAGDLVIRGLASRGSRTGA